MENIHPSHLPAKPFVSRIAKPAALLCAAALWAQTLASPVMAQAVETAGHVQKLIAAAEPGTRDAAAWAKDMLSVLDELRMSRSAENVCSIIAIVDQESGFVANPAVPGLGAASLKALNAKLDNWSILGTEFRNFLSNNPAKGESFLQRIQSAKTERDLDHVYREALTHLASSTGLDDLLVLQLVTDVFETQNDIRTIGSMQVSVNFALDTVRRRRGQPLELADIHKVRDLLYTRKGGLHFGTLQLLDYETGYDRKIFRFADYNAGRYASRNAALQMAVSRLTGRKLAHDGDLLIYGRDGKPRGAMSNSEQAILAAAESLGLNLSKARIRTDLMQEKSHAFIQTDTFKLIHGAYRQRFGMHPPFAVLPDIQLSSVKMRNRMTTASFATTVNGRYLRCMARARADGKG